MLSRKLSFIAALFATLFLMVGCSAESTEGGVDKGVKYGTIQFGEEQIPVNFVTTLDEEDMLLVVLSPLTNPSNLTTNAIFGVRSELLGTELDVEYFYCNDDYVIVYEDPQCYYAPFRRPQSGTIKMQKSGDIVILDVAVELFDGTPLRYKSEALPLK